jgi:16S rRNA (adenine1518-N6/adenine1519-N6)-dimethyltransferase
MHMARFQINQPSDLVRHYRHRAKKQFGQHFLVDPGILDNLIAEAGVSEGDRVLEIGPGCGTLTWRLLEHGADVLAVELDRQAVEFLEEIVQFDEGFRLVEGDVLDQDVAELLGEEEEEPWRCVANLPYNLATEILFHLAPHFDRFSCLVLMFQREVAHRIVAEVGGDDYGRLSLMTHLYADVEIVQKLAPGAFQPPPRVHSAAVRFEPVEGTRIPDDETRRRFERLVAVAFQTRRKILPNALAGIVDEKDEIEATLETIGIDRMTRPEQVAFDEWVSLAERLEVFG